MGALCVFWPLTCSPSPQCHPAETVTPGSKSKLNLILIHLIEEPDLKVETVFDLLQGMGRKDYGCLSYLGATERKGSFAFFFPIFCYSFFFPSTWCFPLNHCGQGRRSQHNQTVINPWLDFHSPYVFQQDFCSYSKLSAHSMYCTILEYYLGFCDSSGSLSHPNAWPWREFLSHHMLDSGATRWVCTSGTLQDSLLGLSIKLLCYYLQILSPD